MSPSIPFGRDATAPADLLVIGGGINGAGIARDAAGRGLRVVLCEQNDLASGTSSMSSKLIHGGLRYLEYGEFRLVREALAEREVMLRIARHMCWPLPIVLPQVLGLRPAWMIRLGLFFYDYLGGRRQVPASSSVDLRRDPAGTVLEESYRHAFRFYDCWIDDARLVVLNAMDAAARGAAIRPRTRCIEARRDGLLWRARLRGADGSDSTVWARALVNAAGPWAGTIAREVLALPNPPQISLVKGSHLVVPRLAEGRDAFMLQNPDRRVVFVLPYEDDFTLIGTTEEPHVGDPASAAIDADEMRYLLATAGRFLRHKLQAPDVIWSFAGVRPLIEGGDATSASRDYSFAVDEGTGRAPLLQVLGGKLTTYRRLAEEALARLAPAFPGLGGLWTAAAALPGSDETDFAAWDRDFLAAHATLPAALLRRLVRTYGTRAAAIVGTARDVAGLGESFGAGLSEAELAYQKEREWAATAQDALWRRTKMGLRLGAADKARVERWFGG